VLLRADAGYRMMDHKCNEYIREPGIIHINMTKNYQEKCLERMERMPENSLQTLLYNTN
jgi:hypothetical protein